MNYLQSMTDEETISLSFVQNFDNDEPSSEELRMFENCDEFEEIYHDSPIRNKFEGTLVLYYKSIKALPLLSEKEVIELSKKVQNGDENARNELVERNLLLVLKVANHYSKLLHLDIEDLIQDGNIGLMTAAQKFDHTFGCHFSTYATWWIRQAILRGVSNSSRTIKIPAYAEVKISKLHRAESEFASANARKPSISELSQITNISESEITKLRLIANTVSLSTPINKVDEDSVELGDILPDFSTNVEEMVEKDLLVQTLKKNLARIINDNRAYEILIMRYGLFDSPKEVMSLDEIASMFGITRERVRQIELTTLKKLKTNKEFFKKMKAYL